MAEEAVGAGEGVDANRIAWVRETVRMTLDDELATGTARAQNQAGLYRELVNYPMSPELRQHVTTRLTQLQQVDPSISSEPLGNVRLGGVDRRGLDKPEPRCEKCFMVHAGDCL
jgi:hypothetical protein